MSKSLSFRRIFAAAYLLFQLSTACFKSHGASGDVDLSFDPGSGVNGEVKAMAMPPDGKLIIGGRFSTVRGLARQGIARLNPDGSGDPTFDAGTNADQYISAIALQPDGKVIFTRGDFATLSGYKMARLNTDGILDASFVPSIESFPSNSAFTCLAVQPDGRIVLGGFSTEYDGFGNSSPRALLIRLNANGSIDNTFTNGNGTFGGPFIFSVGLQSDGRILVAGNFVATVNGTNHYGVARLNTNGTMDTNFQFGADGIAYSVGLQPDGKILLAGYGIGNSTNWNGIGRLNPDGSLDATFQPGIDINSSLVSFVIQADGKVVCIGGYVYVGGTNRNLVRLNSNGSLDASFNPSTGAPDAATGAIALQGDGKILIGGGFSLVNGTNQERLDRLNSTGTLDASFDPGSSINAAVNGVALQEDGKAIIGGDFTIVGGAQRNRIARLKANGALDSSFDPGVGPAGPYHGYTPAVTAVTVQPDGKILVGGDFSGFNGISRNRLARLNTNGTVDTTFVPWIGAPLVNYAVQPTTFVVQPDGKILVGGNAAFSFGSDGTGLARLNADGSFDNSFHPDTLGTNGADYAVINSLALQPDGKIIAGGYTVRSDVPYYLLTRLITDGSRDTNFATAGGSAIATSIALQPDGNILVGGWYGDGRGWFARFNTNGNVDNTFSVGSGADGSINCVLLQSDGKILIAGSFTSVNGANRNRIARLNWNGSLDTNFNVNAQVGVVSTAALQPDGNVLVAGSFTTGTGIVRLRVARLYGDSTLPSLTITRSNSFAVVSWSAAFGNFQLQANTNLSLSNGWSSIVGSRSTNNGFIFVTRPATNSHQLFRLSSQ